MKKIFPLFFLLVSLSTSAQILHDNTCSGLGVDYVLDWDSSPSSTQFDWTPQGGTSFLASNIEGEGGTVKFTISGATGSLTTENSISTPGVTNSLSGGEDALHISTDGLTSAEEIVVKMEFLPAISGNISFDLYNIIELAGGGSAGQQIEIYALSSDGFALVPELSDNGSPSWEVDGPGVIQGNATSTAGTNDQVGVNFKSIGDALNDLVARVNTYEAANTNPGHYVNADDGDGDGIPNWAEDTDGDGTPNFLDPDNGLFRDFDGDGLVVLYDTDQNGSASIQPDADGDGEFDFRDIDNTVSLPVELLSFEIQKLFASVEINWVTVSEINNDYFIVQKLNPEREYNDLVKVDGAGNSNLQLSYQAIDDRPFKGENYYRLKQVDFDGTTTFTEPKMVLFNSFSSLKSEIELYPNPGNG